MEFITDRTYADVQKVIEYQKRGWKNLYREEQNEWYAGMKGALNDYDLNRMAKNLIEIRDGLIKRNSTPIDWQINSESDSYVYIDNYDYIYIVTDVSKVRVRVVYYTDTNVVDHQEYLASNAAVIYKAQYAFIFVQVFYDTDYKDTYVGGADERFTLTENARTDWKWSYQNPNKDWLPINALHPIINNVNSLKRVAYSTVKMAEIASDLSNFDFQRANQIEEYSKLMYDFAVSKSWRIRPEWKKGYIIDEEGNEIADTTGNHELTTDYIPSIIANFRITAEPGTKISVYKYIVHTYGVIYDGVEEFTITSNTPHEINTKQSHSIKILASHPSSSIAVSRNISIIV